jgi:hypothetical protein
MTERYFYAHGVTEHGPYSAVQMREFAHAGQISPNDSIWREGSTQRFPASSIKNLYSDPAPRTSPTVAVTSVAPVVAAPETAPSDSADAEAEQPQGSAGHSDPVNPPKPAEHSERLKRVVSIRGGILCSQDGVSVRFKKKCEKCGYEDAARSVAPIRTGSMRISFYCRKCRKSRTVEMNAVH